jgi:hypothetical protein
MVEEDNKKVVLERKITLMNGVGIIVGSIIGKVTTRALQPLSVLTFRGFFQDQESSFHLLACTNTPSESQFLSQLEVRPQKRQEEATNEDVLGPLLFHQTRTQKDEDLFLYLFSLCN